MVCKRITRDIKRLGLCSLALAAIFGFIATSYVVADDLDARNHTSATALHTPGRVRRTQSTLGSFRALWSVHQQYPEPFRHSRVSYLTTEAQWHVIATVVFLAAFVMLLRCRDKITRALSKRHSTFPARQTKAQQRREASTALREAQACGEPGQLAAAIRDAHRLGIPKSVLDRARQQLRQNNHRRGCNAGPGSRVGGQAGKKRQKSKVARDDFRASKQSTPQESNPPVSASPAPMRPSDSSLVVATSEAAADVSYCQSLTSPAVTGVATPTKQPKQTKRSVFPEGIADMSSCQTPRLLGVLQDDTSATPNGSTSPTVTDAATQAKLPEETKQTVSRASSCSSLHRSSSPVASQTSEARCTTTDFVPLITSPPPAPCEADMQPQLRSLVIPSAANSPSLSSASPDSQSESDASYISSAATSPHTPPHVLSFSTLSRAASTTDEVQVPSVDIADAPLSEKSGVPKLPPPSSVPCESPRSNTAANVSVAAAAAQEQYQLCDVEEAQPSPIQHPAVLPAVTSSSETATLPLDDASPLVEDEMPFDPLDVEVRFPLPAPPQPRKLLPPSIKPSDVRPFRNRARMDFTLSIPQAQNDSGDMDPCTSSLFTPYADRCQAVNMYSQLSPMAEAYFPIDTPALKRLGYDRVRRGLEGPDPDTIADRATVQLSTWPPLTRPPAPLPSSMPSQQLSPASTSSDICSPSDSHCTCSRDQRFQPPYRQPAPDHDKPSEPDSYCRPAEFGVIGAAMSHPLVMGLGLYGLYGELWGPPSVPVVQNDRAWALLGGSMAASAVRAK